MNILATDQPGVRYNLLGNSALKPERSTEFEAGFETKLANNRVSIDLTFYHKKHAGRAHQRHRRALGRRWRAEQRSRDDGASQPRRDDERRVRVPRQRAGHQSPAVRVGRHAQRVDEPEQAARSRRHAAADQRRDARGRGLSDVRLVGAADHGIPGQEQRRHPHVHRVRPLLSDDTAACEVFVGDSAVFRGYTQPRHLVTLDERLRPVQPQAPRCRRCSTTAAATRRTTTPSASAARAGRTATG